MRPNLVLIHSFPTNSVILRGLIEYLQDYFHVYFIDLPGFNNNYDNVRPISIKYFTNYVENYINNLFLDKYWIGGISFGFLIANVCAKDNKCHGVIAMEPYLNQSSLNFNLISKYIVKLILNAICVLNIHYTVWKNRLFVFLLKRLIMPSESLFILTYKLVHPYVFFETAKIIFDYNNPLFLLKDKYILIINEHDNTINTKMVLNLFKMSERNFLLILTSSDHYPKNITKQYFEKHICKEDINRIRMFIDNSLSFDNKH